jgi:D-beta-D-heptose 7-phosphate kinase/D-beta-D-heptose 1-phosphate adenosyltransferase
VAYQRELLDRVTIRESRTAHWRSRVPTAELGSPRELDRLVRGLEGERGQGRTIVFTNGVFDILHAGHVYLLRQAKELGDVLVVGINSDRSVRRLKGRSRPINNEEDRLAVVAALDSVDHVVLFDEDTPVNLIRALRPDIHVKGGDYRPDTLPEASAVKEVGGRIVILPRIAGLSTTGVIDRIATLETVVWEGA